MAGKKRQKKRHHRRGRYALLRKLLSLLLIGGAVVAAMILFFRLDKLEIVGNQRYSVQEITEKSGVTQGENLFLLNKYEVSRRIYTALPYVEEVQVHRRLPTTLVIEVTEAQPCAIIEQEGIRWLVSRGGKLLEQLTASDGGGVPEVRGIHLLMPTLSSVMAVAESDSEKQTVMQRLLEAVEEEELISQIRVVDLSNPYHIVLNYGGRFTVQIPWDSDYSYQLRYLKRIVEQLEDNEKGVIDMTETGEAHFIPEKNMKS